MIGNTVLEKFIEGFGNRALEGSFDVVYQSPLVNMIIFSSGVLMFLNVGMNLHRKPFTKKVMAFWIAWLAIIPIKNRPFSFWVVSETGKVITRELTGATDSLFRRIGAMPPGYVIDVITSVSSGPLKDPVNRRMIDRIVRNCVPENAYVRSGMNHAGQGLYEKTKVNVFHVLAPAVKIKGNSLTTRYVFDESILKNRKVGEIDCHSYLEKFHKNVHRELLNRNLGNPLSGSSNVKDAIGGMVTRDLKAAALTAGHYNAIRTTTIEKYNGMSRGSTILKGGLALNAEVEGMTQTSGLVSMFSNVFDFGRKTARAFHVEGVIDSASNIQDLSEKIYDMPYYFGFLLLIMKVILPFLLPTLFFGSLNYLKMWVKVYFLILLIPFIVQITFYAANSIIYKTANLDKFTRFINDGRNGYLGNQINEVIDKSTEDTTRMASVITSTLKSVLGFLMLGIPATSALATRKGQDERFKRKGEAVKGAVKSAAMGVTGTLGAKALVSSSVGQGLANLGKDIGGIRGDGFIANALARQADIKSAMTKDPAMSTSEVLNTVQKDGGGSQVERAQEQDAKSSEKENFQTFKKVFKEDANV